MYTEKHISEHSHAHKLKTRVTTIHAEPDLHRSNVVGLGKSPGVNVIFELLR